MNSDLQGIGWNNQESTLSMSSFDSCEKQHWFSQLDWTDQPAGCRTSFQTNRTKFLRMITNLLQTTAFTWMFVRISSFHACLRISACVAIQTSVIKIKWLNIAGLTCCNSAFSLVRVENRGRHWQLIWLISPQISRNTNTKLKSILYICRHETQIQTTKYTCTRNTSVNINHKWIIWSSSFRTCPADRAAYIICITWDTYYSALVDGLHNFQLNQTGNSL